MTSKYTISKKEKNIKLSGNTHEMKRILNEIPDLTRRNNILFRRALLQISNNQQSSSEESMFSREEAKEFLKKYEEGNKNIADRYFDGEDLFDMDLDGLEKWELDYKSMEEDMIRFIGHTAIQLRSENEKLNEKILFQQEELEKQRKAIELLQKQLKHPFGIIKKSLFKQAK